MIKTLFKLAVFLLMLNALVRFVPPYYHHQQFKEDVGKAALEWRKQPDAELVAELLAVAAKHEVPITVDNIAINRANDHLYVSIVYEVPLQLVPRTRTAWKYEVHEDIWIRRPPINPR